MNTARWMMAVALVGAVGCAHKPEAKKDASPENTGPKPISNRLEPTNSCTRDLDCGPKQLCIRNQCVDISANLAECGSVRVFFPLNSSDLPSDTSTVLERSARCLKADLALHVTIEGNADERGTEEYNMALGDRRATAVAKYLERLGASQAQLKTVSYGKENPLCVEHDEDCWGKNRRAELNVAGAQGKTPPAKKK
jgi:peptidoglycan-associated lipoprotein